MDCGSEILDTFFPPACPACRKVLRSAGIFCVLCEFEIAFLPSPHCNRCVEPGEFPRGICPRCQLRPASFQRAFAPFAHEGPVARAIHRFKYEDSPELAASLAALLLERSKRFLGGAPPTVCAIPLHRKRFLERKYDQAVLLAQELSTRADLRSAILLRRTRNTRRQVGLTEDEREINVSLAFEAVRPLKGQRILLIDDVITTGATARAAASALLKAGCVEVQVLALARAF